MPTVGMPQTTVQYIIDCKRSTFVVRAFATGLLSAFGHNPTIAIPNFEVVIDFNSGSVEQSSMRLEILSAALTVTDDIREKDRVEINRTMHEEVLESESFPNIVYECSGVSASSTSEGQYSVTMSGNLTLHGITRSQPVSARLMVNGDTLRTTGNFSIRQSDYEIRPVSAAGGTIKLKDELKLSFDISARRKL